MNRSLKLLLARSGPVLSLGRTLNGGRLLLSSLMVWGAAYCAHAQTINANATLSWLPAGVNYDYTITLNNTAGSTSPIETLWYAWVPGEDFLPSSPITVQPPSGWTQGITHGGPTDGYAIEFVTSTAPLNPGNSLTFQFQSADSPAALAGNSPFYPTTPVGTSFVYEGSPFTGASESFIVQSVPEPSALALFLIGFVALLRSRSSKVTLRSLELRIN